MARTTYRDRRLAKAERLRVWATKRKAVAAATFKANEPYTSDHAFNTQPGHIPERTRIIAREDRAFESLRKARRMESRADNIEAQADRAIYSDDPDAIERLAERIVGLEAGRDRMKSVNAEIKRGPGWEKRLADAGAPLTEGEKGALLNVARYQPYYCKNGVPVFPPYALSNQGANIRRLQKRMEYIQRRSAPPKIPQQEAVE